MNYEYIGSGEIKLDTQKQAIVKLAVYIPVLHPVFEIVERIVEYTTPQQVYAYFSSRLKEIYFNISLFLPPFLLYSTTLGDSSYG